MRDCQRSRSWWPGSNQFHCVGHSKMCYAWGPGEYRIYSVQVSGSKSWKMIAAIMYLLVSYLLSFYVANDVEMVPFPCLSRYYGQPYSRISRTVCALAHLSSHLAFLKYSSLYGGWRTGHKINNKRKKDKNILTAIWYASESLVLE